MAKDKSKMGTVEMCFLFCECNCRSAVTDTELPPPASQLQAVTSPLAAQGDVRTALLICLAFRISSLPSSWPSHHQNSTRYLPLRHPFFLSRRLPTPNGLQEPIPLR
jgi:hypothetical protein